MSEVASLAFSRAEYEARVELVREGMVNRGVETLLVTSPENICYLSGFATTGYHVFQALLLPLEGEPRLVLRNIEVDNALKFSWVSGIVVIDDIHEPARSVVKAARALDGGLRQRFGYEEDGLFLSPRMLEKLRETLAPGKLIPSGGIVEDVRSVKSSKEIQYIERATDLAQTALEHAITALPETITDSDVAATVQDSLARSGSEFTGSPPYVVAGPDSAGSHATHAQRPLREATSIWLEIPGSVHRYHGCVSRTVFLHRPPANMERAAEAASMALASMIEVAKPGVTAGEVDAAGRKVVASYGFDEIWKNRAAYGMGLSFPPGLGEGHIIDIKPGDRRVLLEGMVFHFIPILKVAGLGAVGCTETVVVEKGGARTLVRLPRRIGMEGQDEL